MKYSPIIILLVIISSCNQPSTPKTLPENNIDWLLGTWNRTNDQEGQKTYEHWDRKSATVLEGIGYTMVEKDTVSKEYMKILPINGVLNLEVILGKDAPVYFPFTSQTKGRFICENKENDFPKKIEYFMEGAQLKAIVSNEEITFPFIFER